MQKWKKDPTLYNCPRNNQGKKQIDYYQTYVNNFLKEDPVKDWESIDRCVKLFNFFIKKADIQIQDDMLFNDQEKLFTVLDCGTKDGQFVNWLNQLNLDAFGIEIDDRYVEYAQNKRRNVCKGDICDIRFSDNFFDIVFAHHVQGLCPDYKKSYQEMLRVAHPHGFIITCNQIPGNPKKHYSLINSPAQVKEILQDCPDHKIIYFNYWQKEDEFVVILQKE